MSKAPAKRGRADNESDAGTEPGIVGTFETLRDEGEHFVHVKQYEKAIESFTKALDMKPEDKTCLVIRSKCYLMLGNAEKALTDAEAALGQEDDGKRDIRALNMKAEALYQKGDFENALVFYHRGNKLRPELQEFRLGIQKCEEAIDNSIGDPVSVQLEATGDLSYFYKQNEKKQQKGYTKVNQPKKEEKKERQRPQDSSKSKTTKELLGQLYQDKEFLEKLFDSLSNNGNKTDDYIKGRACDGLEYLNNRSDFWRQQKPMYARVKDQRKGSGKGSGSGGQSGGEGMKYVLNKLEEIDQAQSEGRYQESLDKCKLTMKRVDNMPESADKPNIMANLYSLMGIAYFELGKYSQALEWHNKDLDLATENDLKEAESRALDNLGRTHAKLGDYQEAIDIWESKLPNSKSALENTWLYHEIGRCQLELGEYEKAKDYGEKSLSAAKETDDISWQVHALVLVAQSEAKCEEYEAASGSFTLALELAEQLNDKPAQNAIKKALQEVNDKILHKDGESNSDHEKDRSHQTSSPEAQDTDKEKGDSEKEGRSSPARSPSPKGNDHKKEKDHKKESKEDSDTTDIQEKHLNQDDSQIKINEDEENGSKNTTETKEIDNKENDESDQEKNESHA
ncbi:Tetratricopeptide repeat protein 25 [Bulinus truncatus]|nr:Tetratricopeptide repeat protein 25 [Bulinus truncatus]